MRRRYWEPIYIQRDPSDPLKGWGWVEVEVMDVKRLGIPRGTPEAYKQLCGTPELGWGLPRIAKNLPSRGKAGTKKFFLSQNGETIELRAQKFLTIAAICFWAKTWASPEAQLVTPGGRAHSLNAAKVSNQAHFIYFIFNEHSNAIKIGRAKNVTRRLRSLQTSSPAPLLLLKTIQVEGAKAARATEKSLHQQFSDLRLSGEWFRADAALRDYIKQA